jgi:hypothetical protein
MALRLFRKFVARDAYPAYSCDDDDEDLAVFGDPMELCVRREPRTRRGSVTGRQVVLRGLHEGDARLGQDYFNDIHVYDDKAFRRRFGLLVNIDRPYFFTNSVL